MSSFPDVLSTELIYTVNGSNNKTTFTVPAEYAFAVVQVCLKPENVMTDGVVVSTSHGSFSFDDYTYGADNMGLKDFPILNLIIKGGEAFSLSGYQLTSGWNSGGYTIKAKVTELCHKKPT